MRLNTTKIIPKKSKTILEAIHLFEFNPMVYCFQVSLFFPKPPKAISEQKEADDKNKPKDDMGLTDQIYGSKRIVDNMDNDAWDNTSRAPVEPANKDSEQHGRDKNRPKPVKRSENKGRDENGNPRMASHLQQTTKNKAAKTNLFYNGAHDTTIKCSCNS